MSASPTPLKVWAGLMSSCWVCKLYSEPFWFYMSSFVPVCPGCR